MLNTYMINYNDSIDYNIKHEIMVANVLQVDTISIDDIVNIRLTPMGASKAVIIPLKNINNMNRLKQ